MNKGWFKKGHTSFRKKGEFKHSEETKQKLSQIKIGKPSWNKGFKKKDHPSIEKMGFQKENKLWNHPNSIQTRFKKGITPWVKGKRNPNAKNNPQIFQKGSIPWNKGKTYRFNKNYISPWTTQIRESIKYKEWRQQIFIRDNFICQKCKKKGGKLHAHHYKKTFSKLLQEIKQNLPLFNLYDGAMIYTPFWDIDNGQTLCEKCHKKTKSYLNKHFKI